jgi:hypothetical protein
MSVLLGACGGSDHAPALLDVDEDTRLDGSEPGFAGASGNNGASGSSGANSGGAGSYIPTPMETEPGQLPPVTDPMGQAGQGGQAGSSSQPSQPCSRGTLTGNFSARSQSDLQDLSGYTEVTGELYVGTSASASATDVSSLAAMSCLRTVGGHFTILENPLLTNLHGLEALEQVTRLTISTNSGLETLEGPTALAVSTILNIRANRSLTSLGTGITGAVDLYISDNSSLPLCEANAFATRLGVACQYCTGNAACP